MVHSSVAALTKTRSWEKAEDFKRKLEEEYEAKQEGLEEASRPKSAPATVKEAVSRFLNSKRNENLADSTLDKLTTNLREAVPRVGHVLRIRTHH
jgi:hypothetical protein